MSPHALNDVFPSRRHRLWGAAAGDAGDSGCAAGAVHRHPTHAHPGGSRCSCQVWFLPCFSSQFVFLASDHLFIKILFSAFSQRHGTCAAQAEHSDSRYTPGLRPSSMALGNHFISSFLTCMLFLSFSCLIALARISSTLLNKMVRRDVLASS